MSVLVSGDCSDSGNECVSEMSVLVSADSGDECEW